VGYGSKHVQFSAIRPLFRGRSTQHLLRNGKEKIRYETVDDARVVVKQMRADAKNVQAYHCRECSGFHIGNRRHMDKVPDREIDLFIELGDRAFAHMRAQNGKRTAGERAVKHLIQRAIDKFLYPPP
jgi:hypothetical protein